MTKNDLLVDFAGNLKKLRMERGLTLRDLAEAVNAAV